MPLRGTGWVSLPFRSSEVLEFSTAKWRVVAWSLLLHVEVNESRPKAGAQVIACSPNSVGSSNFSAFTQLCVCVTLEGADQGPGVTLHLPPRPTERPRAEFRFPLPNLPAPSLLREEMRVVIRGCHRRKAPSKKGEGFFSS